MFASVCDNFPQQDGLNFVKSAVVKGQKTVTIFPLFKRMQADVEKASLRLAFVVFLCKNTQQPSMGMCKLARNLFM